jgi:hypothetical protein
MKRTFVSSVSLLLAPLLLPAPGQAQTRLIPQVGLYASISDLGTVDTADGIRTVGEQETSLAYGLTLDMAYARTVGYRLTGLYGTRSEIPVGGIGCSGSECDLRSTLLGLSASVVLRLLPVSSPFRPYLLAGGGMKRYDFEFDSDSQLKDAFGDESKASGVLGAGFDWSLGILKGNLELTDYISGSVLEDGDRQHDFFLTVGLILG